MNAPTLLISAGEPSGDRVAARFLEEFTRRHPGTVAYGLGGPALRSAGLQCLARMEDLAVVGLVEALGKVPTAFRTLGLLARAARERAPDLVVPVDFPDFNLRLAARARRMGRRVLYYVSPQVWAWREGRVARIRRDVDRMAVVFPFEEEFYRRHAFRADFVGHPLLEELPEPSAAPEHRPRLGFAADRPLMALYPGSREGEVARHWPLLLDVARELLARRPDVQLAAARAPGLPAGRMPVPAGLPVSVLSGEEHALFYAADAAAVAAGTATLEGLLAGCPMAVYYRTSALTYAVMRRAARVQHVSLANLVAGEPLVREFLQESATPAALADELLRLHQDPEARARMRRAGAKARSDLGGRRASEGVCRLAEEMIWTNA